MPWVPEDIVGVELRGLCWLCWGKWLEGDVVGRGCGCGCESSFGEGAVIWCAVLCFSLPSQKRKEAGKEQLMGITALLFLFVVVLYSY